jgi:Uma2 family endonuclease
MKLTLVDEKRCTATEPYLIKLYGWSEEKYYREAPPDAKCEFVQGEVVMYCPMSAEHSTTVMFLGSLLRIYCDAKQRGEALTDPTVQLAPEINRQPDICFVPAIEVHRATGMPMKVVPSFIIEVSWSTQESDLGEKALDYPNAGVQEYWVVDIENSEVVVHILNRKEYHKTKMQKGLLESQVIQGFFIQIEWLWQTPLPSTFECLKTILGSVG